MHSGERKVPIERALDNMFDILEDMIPHMPKDAKHTWGQKFFNLELDCYEALYEAKEHTTPKKQALKVLKNKFFLLTKLLKRAHDKRFIATKPYIRMIPHIGNIERQLNGWIKSTELPESIQS